MWKIAYILPGKVNPTNLQEMGEAIVGRLGYKPRLATYYSESQGLRLLSFIGKMEGVEIDRDEREIEIIIETAETNCLVICTKKKKLERFLRILLTRMDYDDLSLRKELEKILRMQQVIACNFRNGEIASIFAPTSEMELRIGRRLSDGVPAA